MIVPFPLPDPPDVIASQLALDVAVQEVFADTVAEKAPPSAPAACAVGLMPMELEGCVPGDGDDLPPHATSSARETVTIVTRRVNPHMLAPVAPIGTDMPTP